MAKPTISSPLNQNPFQPEAPEAQPSPQPNPSSEGLDNYSATSSDETAHLDKLLEAEAAGEVEAQFEAAAAVRLGKEEFHKVFITGFKITHGMSGYKCFDVQEGDPAARECAGALYDTIVDIPALHFILEPRSKWLGRIIAIGAFTLPMGRAFAEEKRSKMQARAKPEKMDFAKAREAVKSDDGNVHPNADQAATLGAA